MSFGGGNSARTSRGGRDQFDWSDVAASKDRESYVGHSLLAPVGRWQKGRDLTWYAKDKSVAGVIPQAQLDEIQREKELIKQQEEDRRLEALGLKKRVVKPMGSSAGQLDAKETKQLFGRTAPIAPTAGGAPTPILSDGTITASTPGADTTDTADRVSGLGFKREPGTTSLSNPHDLLGMELQRGDTMEGTATSTNALDAREAHHLETAGPRPLSHTTASSPTATSSSSSTALPSSTDLQSLTLAQQRAILAEADAIRAKLQRKLEKQALKEAKKLAKKEKSKSKKKKRSRSRSRSRSVSRSPSTSRSRSHSRDHHRDDRSARHHHRDRPRSHSRSRSRSRSRDHPRRERESDRKR